MYVLHTEDSWHPSGPIWMIQNFKRRFHMGLTPQCFSSRRTLNCSPFPQSLCMSCIQLYCIPQIYHYNPECASQEAFPYRHITALKDRPKCLCHHINDLPNAWCLGLYVYLWSALRSQKLVQSICSGWTLTKTSASFSTPSLEMHGPQRSLILKSRVFYCYMYRNNAMKIVLAVAQQGLNRLYNKQAKKKKVQ